MHTGRPVCRLICHALQTAVSLIPATKPDGRYAPARASPSFLTSGRLPALAPVGRCRCPVPYPCACSYRRVPVGRCTDHTSSCRLPSRQSAAAAGGVLCAPTAVSAVSQSLCSSITSPVRTQPHVCPRPSQLVSGSVLSIKPGPVLWMLTYRSVLWMPTHSS